MTQEVTIVKKKSPRYTTEELKNFQVAYQRNGRNANAAMLEIRPWLKDKPELCRRMGSLFAERIGKITMDLIEAALEYGKLTPGKLIRKIDELLDSKKITKTYNQNGSIVITEEDNVNAIDKALTHAFKIGIGGGYKAEEIRQSGVVGHAHFSLGDLFEKAALKEKGFEESMSPEEYKERVSGLLEEAKEKYENN